MWTLPRAIARVVILGCVSAGLAAFTVTAQADAPKTVARTAERLYDDGVRARRAGRADEAADLLARAARLQPNDADIRLQLGLTYIAQRRLALAESELRRALALAPRYVDVELALARLDLWQGRRLQAEARARRLLRDHPTRADVAALVAVFDAAPAPVAARPPAPGFHLARVDGALGYAHLSGGRAPWREASLAASFAAPEGDALTALIEHAARFERTDTYLELRFDTRLAPRRGVYVLAGATPQASFKPEFAVAGGGWWGLIDAGETLRSLNLLADARHAVFQTGDVSSLSLGVEGTFLSGDLLVTARHINLIDENGDYQDGHALQLRLQADDALALLCGWARAPDTSEGRTFETRSAYAGVQLSLTPSLTASVTYAHDELEGLYDRSSGTLALSYRLAPP